MDMNQYDICPGKYRHYKGNDYEVLGLATHSETLEPMVVYRALYGEYGLWVRPAKMWSELVEVSGQQVTLTCQSGGRGVRSPGTPAAHVPAAAWTRR